MTDRTFGDGLHPEWPDSLWRATTPVPAFAPLEGRSHHDIVIVGAGFTGLWTALELKTLDPARGVTVIDAAQPGYGASGRNGGWCSAMSPMSLDTLATATSPATARAFQMALVDTVAAIGDFVAANGIECGWTKAGTITLARNAPQAARIADDVADARRHGLGEEFLRHLTRDEIESRIRVPDVVDATYSPECATVDPLALCVGLVHAVKAAGVVIHGESRLVGHDIGPSAHRLDVDTPDGRAEVSCDWVLRATEGFTARLRGHRRDVAPLYSYMVATEPLDDDVWSEIGWSARETVTDARRLVIYAQRTRDGRIAFGGRGAPYRFASAVGPAHDTDDRVHDRIVETLFEMFPAARGARITHRWGGALGVARDWHASATVDRRDRTGFAGGYVGDGVALSRLAASGLARAVLGVDDDIARLPIVGHRSRRWESEPLRWLAINGMLRTVALADRLERRTGRPARRLGKLIDSLVG